MQKDKEQGGVTAQFPEWSCSSSEKLDIEQQNVWRFFWSLLGNFQYFFTWIRPSQLEKTHVLAKSFLVFRLFLCEWGSESMGWALQLLLIGTQSELWWALNCLERGWSLSVHFYQLQSTVLVLQNRLEEQNVSLWDCFLQTKEGKQKYCWK